jgi:hypothetical protein
MPLVSRLSHLSRGEDKDFDEVFIASGWDYELINCSKPGDLMLAQILPGNIMESRVLNTNP